MNYNNIAMFDAFSCKNARKWQKKTFTDEEKRNNVPLRFSDVHIITER